MGVPQRLVSLLDKTFSCFFSRHKTQTSKWRRVQDPRKPRRVAQTFLPCSHKGKSKNSKKLLVLWTVTKMVYYPLTISKRIRRCWQIHLWWRSRWHALRITRPSQLHTNGHTL